MSLRVCSAIPHAICHAPASLYRSGALIVHYVALKQPYDPFISVGVNVIRMIYLVNWVVGGLAIIAGYSLDNNKSRLMWKDQKGVSQSDLSLAVKIILFLPMGGFLVADTVFDLGLYHRLILTPQEERQKNASRHRLLSPPDE